MIHGGDRTEVVGVDGSFTGFRLFTAGARFSLVPVSDGAKYPVHVYPNGRNEDPIVVTSAAWQGTSPFENLAVDVAPGGGQAGDTWRFQWAQDESGEGQRPRTDSRGNWTQAVAPPVVLARWTMGGAVTEGTKLPLGVDSNSDYVALDVRAFATVKVVAWTQAGIVDYVSGFLQLKVDCFDEYPETAAKTLDAGTVNNFAAAEARRGEIVIGDVTDLSAEMETRHGTRYRYIVPRVLLSDTPSGNGVEIDGDFVVLVLGYPA